jgi:hypothetical protein
MDQHMTDITHPDNITRVSVIDSARIRAALCADRGLIERAMMYRRIYTGGSAVSPMYMQHQDGKKKPGEL